MKKIDPITDSSWSIVCTEGDRLNLARPKSRILSWNFPEACQITMMLVGLMSRWMTLFACAAMRASRV